MVVGLTSCTIWSNEQAIALKTFDTLPIHRRAGTTFTFYSHCRAHVRHRYGSRCYGRLARSECLSIYYDISGQNLIIAAANIQEASKSKYTYGDRPERTVSNAFFVQHERHIITYQLVP
jgi:hypothetical protein